MRAFAELFNAIDSTTSTNLKVAAMTNYFAQAHPGDAAWATYFLSGRKIKRLVGSAQMHSWLAAASDLPQWLIEDTYSQVGDLAETIALLADVRTSANDAASAPPAHGEVSLRAWIEDRLLTLKGLSDEEQRHRVLGWWRELPYLECLVVNKLLTGAFRIGVSQTLLMRAIATYMKLPVATIAHRLMGHWHPSTAFWAELQSPEGARQDLSRPYPFFLAAPLEEPPESLGPFDQWQAEWKWDGIRAQLVKRGGSVFLWSRGEDLMTERFPEILDAARELPEGSVLDGEILAWNEEGVMPFSALQTRIGRKRLTAKSLAEAPIKFLAYDFLEQDGIDIRSRPLRERRARLDDLLGTMPAVFIHVNPLHASCWADLGELRGQSRARRVEGLMIKQLDAPYGIGRQRGAWWKWKIDPFTVDAVMLYAQPGHGRRASLYTDYTFGVWSAEELVPVAKAYSGLTNAEILDLDRWIRQHTVERFGPVRSVQPVQVFELAFEGINRSPRHRSGVALRFPRIARWRTDKPAAEADRLDALHAML